ncbi:MAG: type II toxin-antitoxin system VapB family antitoxin [bacterium]
MRTNVVLDDELIQEAFKHANVKTKKELITIALQEFVRNHSKLDLRDLKGKIAFQEDYDYKKLRKGEKL